MKGWGRENSGRRRVIFNRMPSWDKLLHYEAICFNVRWRNQLLCLNYKVKIFVYIVNLGSKSSKSHRKQELLFMSYCQRKN